MKLIVPLVVCAALLLGGCGRSANSKPTAVGEAAPQFQLAEGTTSFSLEQYRGRVVVVNFWATNCAPCIEELPSLAELSRWAAQQNIAVITISEDEDDAAYRRFLARYHITVPSLRDATHTIQAQYHTTAFPETFIVDPAGVIRRKFVGAVDWTTPEILESLLRLRGQKPEPSRAINQ